MTDRHRHWETVYQDKEADAVSWFQPHAASSLRLIENAAPDRNAAIIDVGGGASVLVDDLLDAGYANLTVLDLAESALAASRARLGARAAAVNWIAADITEAVLPEAAYDVWHDRAVFHFLTKDTDRARYVAQVLRAVKPGGHVIVAAFGPGGPLQCSGLDVARYTPDALHAEFGAPFRLLRHQTEIHYTPAGKEQEFVYCYCVRA
jgi:ubiquinone/menaquinone biosynthesis C-methylase UbiE